MAYTKAGGPWTSQLSSSFTVKAAFLAVALAVLGTGAALLSLPPTHQAVNRADKADALVSFADLKAKNSVDVAWYRFFHERQLTDAQASNQFVGVALTGEVRLARVAVNEGNSMTW
jgi:hypothetical protein